MDANASKGVLDGLLNLGLPGIIIIVLGYAVYTLWKKNNETQEKRLDESKQTTEALVNNTNTLGLLVAQLNKTKDS